MHEVLAKLTFNLSNKKYSMDYMHELTSEYLLHFYLQDRVALVLVALVLVALLFQTTQMYSMFLLILVWRNNYLCNGEA